MSLCFTCRSSQLPVSGEQLGEANAEIQVSGLLCYDTCMPPVYGKRSEHVKKCVIIIYMGEMGFVDPDQGPPEDIEDIRLRHRRGLWIRAGIIAIAGFFVFAFAGPAIVTGASPAAYVIGISTVVLLFIGIVGLVIAMIYQQRVLVRRQQRIMDSRPPGTYRVRIKPRGAYRLVRTAAVGLGFIAVAFYLLPLQVNAASFFADPGRVATFVPTAYRQQCNDGSDCYQVTAGYLEQGGRQIFWPSRVPLDHPFTIAAPVWTLWTGNELVSSRPRAVLQLGGPAILEGLAPIVVIFIGWNLRLGYRLVRDRRPR